MNETQILRLGLFIILALMVSSLVAFCVWSWIKVRAAAKNAVPETPPLKATPQGLEHETAWLIQQSTGKTARVRTGIDKGLVDIEILDDAGQVRGIVQCVPFAMAYSFTPGNVQALYQEKRNQRARSAYLVTSGQFEYAVILEAKRLKIKLLDGASLQRLRQRVNQTPSVNAFPEELFEDHGRWQRPSTASTSSGPAPAALPRRHVVVPRTTPVVIPVDHSEADASYRPSVRPMSQDEKTVWPVAVSHKRNLPTVIIKPVPTETVMLTAPESPDVSNDTAMSQAKIRLTAPTDSETNESTAFYQAQQQLQARKYKRTRTTLQENPIQRD